MSFICHIHNYTEYNEEWNVFSAFNPSKCTHLEQWAADCVVPEEQSWTSCRSFKSNALSIRPTTAQRFFIVEKGSSDTKNVFHNKNNCLLVESQWKNIS